MKTKYEIINEIDVFEQLLKNRLIEFKELSDEQIFGYDSEYLGLIIDELRTKIQILKWVLE